MRAFFRFFLFNIFRKIIDLPTTEGLYTLDLLQQINNGVDALSGNRFNVWFDFSNQIEKSNGIISTKYNFSV